MNQGAIRRLLTLFLAIYLCFAVLVRISGASPWFVSTLLLNGTWGTGYGIGQVLFKATPLLFAAVSFDVAKRAGLFNIGAEGQLAVGSIVAAVVATKLSWAPWPLAVPIALLASAGAGSAFAALPAVLRVRFGAHEVITTLLSNRLADVLVGFLLASGVALTGTVRTPDVAASTLLPRLSKVLSFFHGSAASVAFVLALAAAVCAPLYFRRTLAGREMALVGHGAEVCKVQKIAVGKRTLQAMLLSGAVAGLAASATVFGYKGYFEQGLGAGAGFTGIAVAMLGAGRPSLMILSALLFGTLDQGGLAINGYVPREIMQILTALTIGGVALADAKPDVFGGAPTGPVSSAGAEKAGGAT
ncbi:MAG: hypothetical protein U0174_18455 [Polyangiaceae bacterium]